ncbi:MAG: rhodanese-like domain-containing protein [Verrucomicrobiota bacterium]
MSEIKSITPQDLQTELKSTNITLIDVREEDEWHICHIEGAKLVPLTLFTQQALTLLDKQDDLVLYCHHGMRSMNACEWLVGHGYSKVRNLTGGIDAWSLQVDSKTPRY